MEIKIMDKKKPTDEEIAKAIVKNVEYSKTITYFDEWGNCKSISMLDVIDLIHRLQSENAGLKERGEIVINSLHETIDTQKAEIERLTEELKNCGQELINSHREQEELQDRNAELQKQVNKLKSENTELYKERTTLIAGSILDKQEQKTEVEQLTAEINQRREMMNRMDCNYATELQKNAELQRQVNQLKEELEKAYTTERANIQAEIADAGTSCHWCENITIKNTAKKILDELDLFFKGTTFRKGYEFKKIDQKLKEMGKNYNVELQNG